MATHLIVKESPVGDSEHSKVEGKRTEAEEIQSESQYEMREFILGTNLDLYTSEEVKELYKTKPDELYSPKTFEVPQMISYLSERSLIIVYCITSKRKFTFHVNPPPTAYTFMNSHKILYSCDMGNIYIASIEGQRGTLKSHQLFSTDLRGIGKILFRETKSVHSDQAKSVQSDPETQSIIVASVNLVVVYDLKGKKIREESISKIILPGNRVLSMKIHPEDKNRVIVSTSHHMSVLDMKGNMHVEVKCARSSMTNDSNNLLIGNHLMYSDNQGLYFHETEKSKLVAIIELPQMVAYSHQIFFVKELEDSGLIKIGENIKDSGFSISETIPDGNSTRKRRVPKRLQDPTVLNTISPKRFIIMKTFTHNSNCDFIEVDIRRAVSRILYSTNIENPWLILPRGQNAMSEDYDKESVLSRTEYAFRIYPIDNKRLNPFLEQNSGSFVSSIPDHSSPFYTLEQECAGKISGCVEVTGSELTSEYESYFLKSLGSLDINTDLIRIIVKFL